MHAQVPPEVGHLDELALAVGAVVGLFTRVQAHVRLKVVVTREPLVALLTLEGLLSGVRPLMILQHVLVSEGPVTNVAHEQFVATIAVCPLGSLGDACRVDAEQAVDMGNVIVVVAVAAIPSSVGRTSVQGDAQQGIRKSRPSEGQSSWGRSHPVGSSVGDGAVGIPGSRYVVTATAAIPLRSFLHRLFPASLVGLT